HSKTALGDPTFNKVFSETLTRAKHRRSFATDERLAVPNQHYIYTPHLHLRNRSTVVPTVTHSGRQPSYGRSRLGQPCYGRSRLGQPCYSLGRHPQRRFLGQRDRQS